MRRAENLKTLGLRVENENDLNINFNADGQVDNKNRNALVKETLIQQRLAERRRELENVSVEQAFPEDDFFEDDLIPQVKIAPKLLSNKSDLTNLLFPDSDEDDVLLDVTVNEAIQNAYQPKISLNDDEIDQNTTKLLTEQLDIIIDDITDDGSEDILMTDTQPALEKSLSDTHYSINIATLDSLKMTEDQRTPSPQSPPIQDLFLEQSIDLDMKQYSDEIQVSDLENLSNETLPSSELGSESIFDICMPEVNLQTTSKSKEFSLEY
ncbi:hypothetical protein HK096_004121 [Nowakowskiella sp. JEL0078]|nr:hypothetical protein HK096_004121 [Nowakowskiella sp. JEL0078]